MARGMLTALQAALAGISGGATGYAKYQQQEQERKRQMKEEERAALRDALAQQQFGLEQQRFEAQFGPEAIARQEAREKAANAQRLAEIRLQGGIQAGREERQREEERRVTRLGGQAFLEQARQAGGGAGTKELGSAIANEVVRLGRQLTPAELADLSAAVGGQVTGERKLRAEEERSRREDSAFTPPGYSRTAPTTGGSYGATSTKQQITRREYDALKSQGYSDAQLSARYEVVG